MLPYMPRLNKDIYTRKYVQCGRWSNIQRFLSFQKILKTED